MSSQLVGKTRQKKSANRTVGKSTCVPWLERIGTGVGDPGGACHCSTSGARDSGFGPSPGTVLVCPIVMALSVRPPLQARATTSAPRSKVAAYVALTKPRIIELLLVTTVPTMVVAAHGLPPLELVLFTVAGGALAAGGANAINMVVDRDIDRL